MLFMEEEVRKGIRWLDDYIPEWRDYVAPTILDMGDVHNCILGQIFGHYDDACIDNGLAICDSTYGFYLPDEEMDRYEDLADTWKVLMEETRVSGGTNVHGS